MSHSCRLCLFKYEIEEENIVSHEDLEKVVQIIAVLFNEKVTIGVNDVRMICRPCKEKLKDFYAYYLLVLENQTSFVGKFGSEASYGDHFGDDEFSDNIKTEVFVEPIVKLDENVEEEQVKKSDLDRKSKRLRGVKADERTFSFKRGYLKTGKEFKKKETESRNFSDDDYVPEPEPEPKPKPKSDRKPKRPNNRPKKKAKGESTDEEYEPSISVLKPKEGPSRKERDEMIHKYFGRMCNLCEDNKEHESYSKLNRHSSKEHGVRKHYVCCGAYLSNGISIYRHCLEHENPIQCSFCGMDGLSNTMHTRHLLEVHGIAKKTEKEPLFECHLCKMRYKNKETIEMHMHREHLRNTQTSFVCETCARSYKSSTSLDIHIRRDHLGEALPKSRCPHCNKWILNTGLAVHIRKHMNPPPTEKFKCDKCGSQYTQYHGLLQHQRRHHSALSNRFQCTMCPKGFFLKRYLDEHFAVHTGENLYHCPWCEAGFKSMGNFVAHKRKLHPILYAQEKLENQLKREKKSRPH